MIINIKELKTKEEVIDFFSVYIQEKIDLFQREIESDDSFSKGSYSEFIASRLGAIRAFKKLLAVIPDREKK